MTETLIGLVAQYSPSGREAGAVDWLLGRMRSLGFQETFRDDAGNAVCKLGAGPRQVMLLGHIDTVPGEIPLRVEGDLLFGRGAVDAKGSLACFVDAAGRVGQTDGWQMIVIGAVDEERDSAGARYLVERYRPDLLVVGEPSGWDRITLGYKGSVTLRITTRRSGAHSAGPEVGACDAAIEIWDEVRAYAAALNQGRKRVFEQVSPSLRKLESGQEGFENWATLTVGCRLPEDWPPENWLAAVAEICERQRGTCEPAGHPIPAYRADKNTSLVRAFLGSIRAQSGKPGFLVKSGTADLNIVAPAWGCPAVVYGPGDSALDHTPNEHISLGEYKRAVDVLAGVLTAVMT
jgi:LysW-gamma-L-lysine carboxypeptidase